MVKLKRVPEFFVFMFVKGLATSPRLIPVIVGKCFFFSCILFTAILVMDFAVALLSLSLPNWTEFSG